MEPALADLLNQTVTIAAPSSTNVYGEVTHGTGSSVAARVEPRVEQVRTAEGAVVPSKAYVWMDGNVTVTTVSLLTLPDGSTPVILAVEKHTDETGAVDHTKVIV